MNEYSERVLIIAQVTDPKMGVRLTAESVSVPPGASPEVLGAAVLKMAIEAASVQTPLEIDEDELLQPLGFKSWSALHRFAHSVSTCFDWDANRVQFDPMSRRGLFVAETSFTIDTIEVRAVGEATRRGLDALG